MPKRIPPYIFRHSLMLKLRSTLSEIGLFPSHEHRPRLLIALSGGADSVALLRAIAYFDFHIEAAHCNFSLRGQDSLHDESFVRELCATLGVKLHIETYDTLAVSRQRKCSVEVAARDLRYHFFERLWKVEKYDAIATAHHLGDNVETLFHHLSEGCGIAGLRGIPLTRGPYIRPMLEISKEEISDFLRILEQDYCMDHTNCDQTITRNYIRHTIVPLFSSLNPSFDEAMQRTFENLRETEALTEYALAALRQQVALNKEESIFDAVKIADSPAPLSLLFSILSPFGFSRIQLVPFVKKLKEIEPATIESATHRVLRRSRKLFVSKR